MTIQILPSSTAQQDLLVGDTVYILPQSASIDFASSGAGLFLTGAPESDVIVHGTIQASAAHGVMFDLSAPGSNLRIGTTGRIDADGYAVRLGGEEQTLVNRGTLVSTGTGIAVSLASASHQTAINHGLVRAMTAGATGVALGQNRTDDMLINTGRILGDTAVAMASSESEIDNDGRIAGRVTGIHAQIQGHDNEIYNAGVIVGGSYGIRSDQIGILAIINEGTIRTRDTVSGAAIAGSDAVDDVVNSGRIVGDVRLNGGNDHFAGVEAGFVEGAVYGGLGHDTLRGGSAADLFYGEAGLDLIHGGAGDDRLFGGDDADFLFGEAGADRLSGGGDTDALYGGGGNDLIFGNDGDDDLRGENGADTIRGGTGDDTAWGGAGADRLFGGAGLDTLYGQDGDDLIVGGAGNDTIYGHGGVDLLRGNADADTLYGGNRGDRLEGGDGDDTLLGEGGNDLLFGGDGLDWLFGDAGNDRLTGGDGADMFVFMPFAPASDFGTDRVLDFEDGTDRLVLNLGIPDMAAFLAAALTNSHGNAVIDLSVADPVIFAGTVIIVGAAGQIDVGDFL